MTKDIFNLSQYHSDRAYKNLSNAENLVDSDREKANLLARIAQAHLAMALYYDTPRARRDIRKLERRSLKEFIKDHLVRR